MDKGKTENIMKKYIKKIIYQINGWMLIPLRKELIVLKEEQKNIEQQLIERLNDTKHSIEQYMSKVNNSFEMLNDNFEQEKENYNAQLNRYVKKLITIEERQEVENRITYEDVLCLYKCILERIPKEEEIRTHLNQQYRGYKELINTFVLSEEYNFKMAKEKVVSPLTEKISYSQAGEDAILRYLIRALNIDISSIRYLDIGANNPIIDNNTYGLYIDGASGILVEANKNLINDLKTTRSRDIILNYCIDKTSSEKKEFYVMNYNGLSSMSKKFVENVCKENSTAKIDNILEVKTISFNDIIEKYLDKIPEVVSIDIEGMEEEIIKSIDFNKYRPKIFIIENTEYNEIFKRDREKNKIVMLMKQIGYIEYAFTGINSIFVDIKVIDKRGV